jgi:hypothetical protein
MKNKHQITIELLSELIIVFIGVYSAIMVNNYQNEHKANQLRHDYFKTFLAELDNFYNSATQLNSKIITYLQNFEKAVANKEKPKLIANNFVFFSNTFIIGAAFDGDNFSAIGSDFLSSISRGTSLIKAINHKISNYNRNTHRLLYFNTYDSRRFYLENGQLRDEYKWYIDDLKVIQGHLARFIKTLETGAIPETKQLASKYSQ